MNSHPTFADELPSLGEDVGNPLTVRLSNEIVTLLSSHLYQSPFKAIEELVVNSYDADAETCRVSVPSPGSDLPAALVYDDGIGMDADGLSDLWLIARSKKRDESHERRTKRKQIGKFGIGKLATYAIANNITYVSRTNDLILAVSANFGHFKEDPFGGVPIKLPVTRVTSWSSLQGSEVFGSACAAAGVNMASLFDSTNTSWTIVLLEELKPRPIQLGRLRWVLSSAMPLEADFQLFLNRDEIQSSKQSLKIAVEFDVTDLPSKRIETINKETKENWQIDGNGLVSTSFPQGLKGSVRVTENSLHAGKSADLGRSHGFFVKVRKRLINEEDPLFGLSPLSFQTFNRFRADITVDDLDAAVMAPREGIEESSLKRKVLPMLEEIFYEARARYNDYLKEKEEKDKRKKEHERTYISSSLVEHPIADVLSLPQHDLRQGSEADESWFYLDVEKTETELHTLVKELYSQPRSRKYKFRYTNRGKLERLVQFSPTESTFYLNADHDLVLAYHDDPRAQMLLEDVATAEAVLEVYLREHGMPAHVIGEMLERRDALLRALANERLFSFASISQSLKDSANDEYDLEVALVAASRALGFVAIHIGGAGEPDGLGRFRNYPNGEQKITLEAKSSNRIPSLSQLDFAGLREHVNKYQANGCLLVAPAYPGTEAGEDSAVSCRAKEARISCWLVDQLARVVAAVESRHIGAKEVLDIVLRQFAPADVTAAVDKLLSQPSWEHRDLYAAVLHALRALEGRLQDQARLVFHVEAEVTRQTGFTQVPASEIKKAVKDMAAASQGALVVKGNRVIVNASLEEIERRLSGLTGDSGKPRRGGTFWDNSSEKVAQPERLH